MQTVGKLMAELPAEPAVARLWVGSILPMVSHHCKGIAANVTYGDNTLLPAYIAYNSVVHEEDLHRLCLSYKQA